jgi:hypothetical protein
MEPIISAFSCTILPNYVASLITSFHDLSLTVLMDSQSLFQLTLTRLLSLLVESQAATTATKQIRNRC